MEMTVNNANFKEVVEGNDLVIIDFWAPWCGPCRMLGPVLEEVAEKNNLVVGKINVDEEEELGNRFNIRSIPTIHIYKKGVLVKESVGYLDYDAVVSLIK